MCVSLLTLSSTKHQGFSDTVSEESPMRDVGAVSIYSLGRVVRIHGREHSYSRNLRFFTTRHIFCLLSLSTVCLLFHGAEIRGGE